MKKLSELYEGQPDILIKGIKINSKEVELGDLFVCTMGVTSDRHDYIEDAISNGASAVVVSRKISCSVPTILVPDTNKELPILASRFYDAPEEELQLIAVTGTNGKTTVTMMIQDLLGDDICGYLGTNGIRCSKFHEKVRNTTPDSDRLYKYFRKFVSSGCKVLSMETSSEAYFRNRINRLEFEVGVVTNITEDHLNIHKTIENYVSCKKQMLRQVKKDGYSILNMDDKYFEECRSACNGKILTYGKKEGASLQIVSYQMMNHSTHICLKYQNQLYEVDSPLVGEFNVYNLCASLLALVSLGKDFSYLLNRVSKIQVPDGRMQFLEYGQKYKIVLDYAHTPDAFLSIYPFLKHIARKKIITVTGSAGGREKEKRAPMGKIVLENSDFVFFTMDDPRNEDVESIIDDLISASDKKNYRKILSRKDAIYEAFDMAEEDDIVLIAGKGTDNYMAVGNEYLPYSDLDTIQSYFENRRELES